MMLLVRLKNKNGDDDVDDCLFIMINYGFVAGGSISQKEKKKKKELADGSGMWLVNHRSVRERCWSVGRFDPKVE